MSEPATGPASVYALLADGRTVQIRPATHADYAAVKAMHEAMSPNNAYLRFFSLSRLAAEQEARRVTRDPGPDHAALLAIFDGQVAGLASYEVARSSAGQHGASQPGSSQPGAGRTAEVAFAVADTMHHRGIATLLLEHLVSLARAQQLTALTAETLQQNTGMLRVFSDAGLPVMSKREDGVVAITIPLPPDDSGRQLEDYLESVAVRERSANVASLRPVFAPAAVAVIGVSRQPGTVGRVVLGNIGPGATRGASTRSTPTRGRWRASRASPTSRACRRPLTSRCSPSRRRRSSTRRSSAAGAGCAAWSCSPPPSTRRPAPTCSPPAVGTGCG